MSTMKLPTLLACTALFGALAAPVFAQKDDTQITSSPGKATAARERSVVATVTEVDAAKGTVTLKGPKGQVLPLKVGPEVRNLGQVAVGDRVNVKYLESLSLTLKKDGKELPGASTGSLAGRAPAGERPGGVVAEQVEVTADVVAVDAKNKIVTLKGPQQTVEMRVRDPEQLKLIKVGDQIQAVYTQAVAVSVEPAKKK
jgi:Cu/Ag efflux protein CusF